MSKKTQQTAEVVHLSKTRRKPSYDWSLEGNVLGLSPKWREYVDEAGWARLVELYGPVREEA